MLRPHGNDGESRIQGIGSRLVPPELVQPSNIPAEGAALPDHFKAELNSASRGDSASRELACRPADEIAECVEGIVRIDRARA